MASLFRPEVAEAQHQHWLGQVQLVRPLSLTLLTAGVLGLLLLVLAFLFFGEYTRKARIGGVLVPDLGVIRLVPPARRRVCSAASTSGAAASRTRCGSRHCSPKANRCRCNGGSTR